MAMAMALTLLRITGAPAANPTKRKSKRALPQSSM
jgi:hypothetical protein